MFQSDFLQKCFLRQSPKCLPHFESDVRDKSAECHSKKQTNPNDASRNNFDMGTHISKRKTFHIPTFSKDIEN